MKGVTTVKTEPSEEVYPGPHLASDAAAAAAAFSVPFAILEQGEKAEI